MSKIINEVLRCREKIFKSQKFNKYTEILNIMGIPEEFNYKDCIPKIFLDKDYNGKYLNNEQYNNLYLEMQDYAKDKKINLEKETILVVHPFYPIIRHANFLIEMPQYFKKYLKYERKMTKLLKDKRYNVILFESPDNFARYTYKFYDSGNIKKVIFTEHSTGKVLEPKVLEDIKNIENCKIAGCYGENCIKDVEEQLKDKKIKRMSKLILERAIKL